MGAGFGMMGHLGFPQLTMYVIGFVCLAAVFLTATGAMPRRRLLALLAALLVGAGIALPLMYQQWLIFRDVSRDAPANVNKGIAVGVPSLLLPYPLVRSEFPPRFGNVDVEYMGHFYFFGGLLAFLFLFQTLGLVVYRPRGREWAAQVWTLCALIALLLALGDSAGLWQLLSCLPIIGSVNRHPLRLMPFVVFFSCFSGGLVLERLLRPPTRTLGRKGEAEMGRKGEWEKGTGGEYSAASLLAPSPVLPSSPAPILPFPPLWLALPALLLLAFHVYQCRTALHMAGFVPYPEFPAGLKAHLWQAGQPTGRVCSWGKFSFNETYALQLPQDLAAVYQLPTDLGACPLLESHALAAGVCAKLVAIPLETMKAYGERWHLMQDDKHLTAASTVFASTWQMEVRSRYDVFLRNYSFDSFKKIDHQDGVILAELADVDPLAFAEKNRRQSLPLTMHGRGIDVDVSQLSGPQRVVVNFLKYPNMRAFVDGQPTRCLSDDWNRIMVDVSAGAQLLEVRYHPPWAVGLWLGGAAAAGGLVLTWLCHR